MALPALPALPPTCTVRLTRPWCRWFEGTQLIVISNTLWVGENAPCLTYGMRGMISLTIKVRERACVRACGRAHICLAMPALSFTPPFSLPFHNPCMHAATHLTTPHATLPVQVSGPDRDLHSGNDGGMFAEPMVDLVRVVSTLMSPGGRVLVKGFYDGVEPGLVERAWASLELSDEFSVHGYQVGGRPGPLTDRPAGPACMCARGQGRFLPFVFLFRCFGGGQTALCRPGLCLLGLREHGLLAERTCFGC